MPDPFAPYKNLLARAREIALIDGASSLLGWDEETYMPPAALEFRAGLTWILLVVGIGLGIVAVISSGVLTDWL